MAIKKIITYPAEVLEQKCEPVTSFDKKLGKLLTDLFDTMLEFDGVGIAAPQIGICKQVAIVYIDDESGVIELVNPEIIEQNGEQTGPEGCLSFPDVYGEVSRHYYIKIKAQDRKGTWFELEADNFLARAIQHEIDHLHGTLFTSKIIRYLKDEELERLSSE